MMALFFTKSVCCSGELLGAVIFMDAAIVAPLQPTPTTTTNDVVFVHRGLRALVSREALTTLHLSRGASGLGYTVSLTLMRNCKRLRAWRRPEESRQGGARPRLTSLVCIYLQFAGWQLGVSKDWDEVGQIVPCCKIQSRDERGILLRVSITVIPLHF